ncbi:MAG: hypothetical protein ABSB79_15350 [Syntrophales bacterium]
MKSEAIRFQDNIQNSIQYEESEVILRDVLRLLRLFAQAVTGRNIGIGPLDEKAANRHDFLTAIPCTDGDNIFLPEVMREYQSYDLNFMAYKLAVMWQAGYLEFGTFDFRLSSVIDLFSSDHLNICLRGLPDHDKQISPLEAFFHLFPGKILSRNLFRILEGIRIDHCIRREYRGLRKDMKSFLRTVLQKRPAVTSLPPTEALMELIIRQAIFDQPVESVPEYLSGHWDNVFPLVLPVLKDGMTVRESARATVFLYNYLMEIWNLQVSWISKEHSRELVQSTARPFLQEGGANFDGHNLSKEETSRAVQPLPHWGDLLPDLVRKKICLHEIENLLDQMNKGIPLSPDSIGKLFESIFDREIEVSKEQEEGEVDQGLFIQDLHGLKKSIPEKNIKSKLKNQLRFLKNDLEGIHAEESYYYDEWDYKICRYHVRWCRLKEKEVKVGSTAFVDRTLESYSDLVAEVRKQFQMLKPERLRKITHLERGEEIDINAAIEASIDRRAGRSPSEKVYIEKLRKDRDYATLFLVDMSASTDQAIIDNGRDAVFSSGWNSEKKVIDIEKEALVVMAEALKEIGDEYAIYGFSGYGRKDVDFYCVKDFKENYGDPVKGRIENIKPQRSTRMGPVIRHAIEKMSRLESRIKNIILISDGYPQDSDYGNDRTDKEYAIQDTMAALEEASKNNIFTFCITIDRAGHDYLRRMMPASRYLVIDETLVLPRQLPKIYRKLTS